MKSYKVNDVKGFYFYEDQMTFRDLFVKSIEKKCSLGKTRDLMKYLDNLHNFLDFHSCIQPMNSDYLQDLEWILDEMKNATYQGMLLCPAQYDFGQF